MIHLVDIHNVVFPAKWITNLTKLTFCYWKA